MGIGGAMSAIGKAAGQTAKGLAGDTFVGSGMSSVRQGIEQAQDREYAVAGRERQTKMDDLKFGQAEEAAEVEEFRRNAATAVFQWQKSGDNSHLEGLMNGANLGGTSTRVTSSEDGKSVTISDGAGDGFTMKREDVEDYIFKLTDPKAYRAAKIAAGAATSKQKGAMALEGEKQKGSLDVAKERSISAKAVARIKAAGDLEVQVEKNRDGETTRITVTDAKGKQTRMSPKQARATMKNIVTQITTDTNDQRILIQILEGDGPITMAQKNTIYQKMRELATKGTKGEKEAAARYMQIFDALYGEEEDVPAVEGKGGPSLTGAPRPSPVSAMNQAAAGQGQAAPAPAPAPVQASAAPQPQTAPAAVKPTFATGRPVSKNISMSLKNAGKGVGDEFTDTRGNSYKVISIGPDGIYTLAQ